MSDIDTSKPVILIYSHVPPQKCLILEVAGFIGQLREVADILERHTGEFNTTVAVLGDGGLILGKGIALTFEEIQLQTAEGPTQ